MSSGISAAKVIRLVVGGTIGGLIAYAMLEPRMRATEIAAEQSASDALYIGAVIGAAIGTMLILAEEIQSRRAVRILVNAAIGAAVGALIGVIGVLCAETVFSPLASTRILPLVIAGRVAGWGIMGAAAGLCPGVVAKSRIRTQQGMLGGALGGAAGGVLFDAIATVTGGGSVSRLVGFTMMGAAIGIAVGLIEEMGKCYWLASLAGSGEGRNYILTRPTSVLGRDELADMPLFGDSSVQKQHASIGLSATGAVLMARPGAAVIVNGQPIDRVGLHDGDILQLGRHRLRFHQRAQSSAIPIAPTSDPRNIYQAQHFSMPYSTNINPGMCTKVTVIKGPNAGAVFVLTNAAIMGRDPRCDLPLTGDSRLSRQHARFLQEGGGWVIEDGNSLNGVYINGVRVARQMLSPGDEILAGDSVLQVS